MELLTEETSSFALPFHPPLPLLVFPIGLDQLVRAIYPSGVGCTLILVGGRSSSLFPVSFLGLPLLHGVRSCGGTTPRIPPSSILLSMPAFAKGTDTLSEQNPVPIFEASRTLEAIIKNPKNVGAQTWHSDYLTNPIPCSKGIP
jgi:hypothetical protein